MAVPSKCWSCRRGIAAPDEKGGCGFHRIHPFTGEPDWWPEEVKCEERKPRDRQLKPTTVLKTVIKCSRYDPDIERMMRQMAEIRQNKSEAQQRYKQKAKVVEV